MSVWFCIPSARPNGGSIPSWKAAGYKVAAWRDRVDEMDLSTVDALIVDPYPGYAKAVNGLVSAAMAMDPEAQWFVTGGDDTSPDPDHTPEQIAAECTAHFGGTMGVMQPTGDRFAGGCIDRICGSPWMGREFCQRMYGGNGPLWHEYRHMYPDEELFEVTKAMGILWQRRDLIHLHQHFTRPEGSDGVNWAQPMPEFLREANSAQHWDKYGNIFRARKAAGFPGHEPSVSA